MEQLNQTLNKKKFNKISLRKRNCKSDNLLHKAVKRGDLPTVIRLVKEGSNVNVKDKKGKTAIHYAVEFGRSNIVEYLVNEANVDVNTKDIHGNIPLFYALKHGNLNIAKYFIEKFNTINGYTLLHWASENGNREFVKYLVEEKKMDVNSIDKELNTPVHLAVKKGNLSIMNYLVRAKNANLHIKNKYGQTPIDLANKKRLNIKNNFQHGIVPVLEGINAIIGIAGGVTDILQKFGVIPSEESKNFQKVFDGLAKNYAAIEEVGSMVDRNFAVMKAVYEIAHQTLSEIEETRYEMRLGFQRVIDSITDLRVDDKISKIATFMNDFFTVDTRIINELSRKDRFDKIEELSNAVTKTGGVLHDNLNDIVEQGLAIPNSHSKGDSAENNARFAAFHTLYYGAQVCVSVMFFVIEQYSYLAGDYYHRGELEEYNELCDSLRAKFHAFKGSLLNNNGIINKVRNIMNTLENLPLVKNEREDILELLPSRLTSLKEVEKKLQKMDLPMIPIKPSKIMGVPDFNKSNVTTHGQWKNGIKVSYAVQYRKNGNYSQVSEWSNPVDIRGKANPFLTIAAAGEEGRERLIFRKFEEEKSELVGIIKDKDTIYFRDISRDIYNAALNLDEDRAREEIKVLLSNGADINETFDNGRKAIHAAAQSNNYNIFLDLLNLNKTDINMQDENGYTPIYIAAEAGYADLVKSLIDLGADPNIRTTMNNLTLTPLHIAAYKGFFPVVETLLLSNETDINAKDNNGFTPLHSATFSNSLRTITAIINRNDTHVNAKSKEGLTPLHLAAMNKMHVDAARALLKSCRADVNSESKGNLTALHFAASIGNLDVTKLLIEHNDTNLNAKSYNNLTSLHLATSLNKDNIALELINAKEIEVNAKGEGHVTPLHIATVTEQLNLASVLLKKGALTEAKTIEGLTPLHSAAMYNKYKVIPILTNNGANIEALTKNGSTPLHLASFSGSENTTSILLEKGANITSYDGNGQMPVHLAVLKDSKRTVKILLEHNANLVNATNKNGECAIHLGSRYLDIVQYLVNEKGIDVNIKTRNNFTPVHYAASYGQLDVIKYLIDAKNANFEVRGLDGKIALHLAAEQGHLSIVKYFIDYKNVYAKTTTDYNKNCLHLAAENGKLNIIEYLCNEKKFDIYEKDIHNNCPMHLAAKNNKLEALKFFIDEKHAQINTLGDDKKHLLHFAAEGGSLEVVEYLVNQKNSDVNVKDSDSNVPLHLAAKNNYLDVIKVLLNKNAMIDAKGDNGRCPIHLASENGYLEIVKYLADKGAAVDVKTNGDKTPLLLAASKGHLDVVKYLADEKHVDVLSKDSNGMNALHWAAYGGYLSIVKYLIDTKNVGVNVKDKYGIAPLHYASQWNKLDVVRFLASRNADVNIMNDGGATPLSLAAEENHFDVVKALAEKGADINKGKDYFGQPPLHLAAVKGNLDMVKFLIDKGADIHARDNSDNNCLWGAILNSYKDVVFFLVTKGVDVNAKNKYGETALLNAVGKKGLDSFEIVKFLVENKALIDARDKDGKTPLFKAAVYCDIHSVKFLGEKGANVNVKDNSGSDIKTYIKKHNSYCLPEHYLELFKYLDSHRGNKYFIETEDTNIQYINNILPVKSSAIGRFSDVSRQLQSNKVRRNIGDKNLAIQNNRATSATASSSTWASGTFGWIKDYIARLLVSPNAEISERDSYSSNAGKNNQNASKFNNEACIKYNISLGLFLLQSFLDKKYPLPQFYTITPGEVIAKTLNILEEFENGIGKTAQQFNIPTDDLDLFNVYNGVAGHIRNETFHQIPDVLYFAVKEAFPEHKSFLKILKANIEKMLHKKLIFNSEC